MLVRGADIRALTMGVDSTIAEIRDLNGAVLRHDGRRRDLEPLLAEIKSLGSTTRPGVETADNDTSDSSDGDANAVTVEVLERSLTGARLTIVLPESTHHVRIIQGLWAAKLEIDGRRTKIIDSGGQRAEFELEAPDATYTIELQSTDRLTKLEIVRAKVNGQEVALVR